jgi:hypothetical protein
LGFPASSSGRRAVTSRHVEGGVSTTVRRGISLNFNQKTRQSHRNGRDFEEKNDLAALDTIISYRPMVNDFEFIQPFGGNRVLIDKGRNRKSNLNNNSCKKKKLYIRNLC